MKLKEEPLLEAAYPKGLKNDIVGMRQTIVEKVLGLSDVEGINYLDERKKIQRTMVKYHEVTHEMMKRYYFDSLLQGKVEVSDRIYRDLGVIYLEEAMAEIFSMLAVGKNKKYMLQRMLKFLFVKRK